jgi:hypothetical protein
MHARWLTHVPLVPLQLFLLHPPASHLLLGHLVLFPLPPRPSLSPRIIFSVILKPHLGTAFEFKVYFTVINETGVGESAFVVYYPSNDDHGIFPSTYFLSLPLPPSLPICRYIVNSFAELGFIYQQIFVDFTPGKYEANYSFSTNSSFSAGKYLVMFGMLLMKSEKRKVQN